MTMTRRLMLGLSAGLMLAFAQPGLAETPLKVGSYPANPPWETKTAAGGFEGFEVDIANEVAKRLGTTTEFEAMDFKALFVASASRRVDMVISGVNHGSNSAVNVLYSGTMGAAIEGSFYGCPAVGLSLDDHGADADFAAAVVYGRRIVSEIFAAEVELPLCLNVNVPVGSVGELKGMKLCRQNRGFWREEFYRHEDPRGREYFWLTGEFVNGEPEATDTDEWALANKYVAVVPVQVDLTDYRQLKNLTKVLK